MDSKKIQVKLAGIGFAFLLAVGGCSAPPVQSSKTGSSSTVRGPLKIGQLKIIDAHIHTAFNGNTDPEIGIPYSKETLLKEFKEAGVVGAVSMMSRKGLGFDESLRENGVRFCVGLSEKPNYTEIEAGLRTKRYHCIKIYLGYIHKFAHDVIYRPAYQLARKYKVPMVFHTGDIYDIDGKLKYSDPMTIDEMAVEYRDVNMVIAHLGNPWITTAAEVAYKNPNVYLEASAILIGKLERFTPEQIEEQLVKPIRWVFTYIENPNKLMFGTDWPLTSIRPYLEAFQNAIPPEHWQAVFHDNAARVYGF
jgi:predicted TIM-barrel fold metal-dependent hydrolase